MFFKDTTFFFLSLRKNLFLATRTGLAFRFCSQFHVNIFFFLFYFLAPVIISSTLRGTDYIISSCSTFNLLLQDLFVFYYLPLSLTGSL